MTLTFTKDVEPYILKGSTIDIPKQWNQHGMTSSAVVHLIGTEMKLFFSKAMVDYLITNQIVK